MKVLIDGQEVKALTDVKVIITSEEIGELHLTLTHEGIITDIIREDTLEPGLTFVSDTESKTYEEVVNLLVYPPDIFD